MAFSHHSLHFRLLPIITFIVAALGVALVAGLAYSTADTTNLIPFDAEIGLLVFLVTAAYGLGIFLGYRRYR